MSADSSNRTTRHKLPRLFAFLVLAVTAPAAQSPQPSQDPSRIYDQLSSVGLDPQSVFNVRDAAIDKEDLHLSFSEGAIAFTHAVDGRVTGALFAGEGEVLLIPPRAEEKQSMALFTGSAVLNERFSLAYLRFDDEAIVQSLRRAARPTQAPADLVEKYGGLARNLAMVDALPLAASLTAQPRQATFLHARIVGQRLGTFDLILDTTQSEQLVAAQLRQVENRSAVDIWASFCTRSFRERDGACKRHVEAVSFAGYDLATQVTPPHSVQVEAKVRIKITTSGLRVLIFDLGRPLQLESVSLHGMALPLLAARAGIERNSDSLGVVMPAPVRAGEEYELTFRYTGPILSDAGGGLVYVQERGKWYPSSGLAMAPFDLTFCYPAGWQLLATGERLESHTESGMEYARWRTDHPIPFAGFNLGHYIEAKAVTQPGMPEITSYAARNVETALQGAQLVPMDPTPPPGWHRRPPGRLNLAPLPPPPTADPSRNAAAVAEQAARTIAFLEPRLGKFPFRSLHLTQFPGPDSQGFAGLVYLSSFVFLNPQQRWRGRIPEEDSAAEIIFNRVMAAHETAHQWWGDSVFWDSYREQWLCEALSNYMALLQLESESPDYFATMLDTYRLELIGPQRNSGLRLKEAGAVSLGLRLNSSKFPRAYDGIAYGRGTWLIHMLRSMYRDAAAHPSTAVRGQARGRRLIKRSTSSPPSADPDANFFSVLRQLQETFRGRSMTTLDMREAFETALPSDLRFEDRPSLEWFFDGWVNGTSVPQIELKNVRFSKSATRPSVRFVIRQSECPDSLITSLPLYVQKSDGSTVFLKRVFADGAETEFKLDVPAGSAKLLLDPYRSVLRM